MGRVDAAVGIAMGDYIEAVDLVLFIWFIIWLRVRYRVSLDMCLCPSLSLHLLLCLEYPLCISIYLV